MTKLVKNTPENIRLLRDKTGMSLSEAKLTITNYNLLRKGENWRKDIMECQTLDELKSMMVSLLTPFFRTPEEFFKKRFLDEVPDILDNDEDFTRYENNKESK